MSSSTRQGVPQLQPAPSAPPRREVISVTEEDLEAVALVFGAIKALQGGSLLPKEEDARLTNMFDSHLSVVMSALATALSPLRDVYRREGVILSHKVALYDVCLSQLIELTSAIKPELGTVVKKMRQVHNDLFRLFSSVVQVQSEGYMSTLEGLRASTADANMRADARKQEVDSLQRIVAELKVEVSKAASQGSEDTKKMQLEIQRLAAENASLALRAHRLEADLTAATAALSANNNNNNNNGSSSGAAGAGQSTEFTSGTRTTPASTGTIYNNNNNNNSTNTNTSTNAIVAAIMNRVSATNHTNSTTTNGVSKAGAITATTPEKLRFSSQAAPTSPVDVHTGAITTSAGGGGGGNTSLDASVGFHPSSSSSLHTLQQQQQQQPTQHNHKILPLKQLKTDIESIYASKLQADATAAANKLPRETMEQHMYSWLRHRHGQFPRLIVDHASAIIRSANRYAALDNDVTVFLKILRNDLDESFPSVQLQLKQTAYDLLRLQLKGANPLKTDTVIQEMLAARVNPVTGTLTEAEWKPIVEYMYFASDAESLGERIRNGLLRAAVAAELGTPPPPATLALTPRGVSYTEDEQLTAAQSAAAEAEAKLNDTVAAMTTAEAMDFLQRVNPKCKLPWTDFLKTMLDFQLAGHEKFLSKFRRIFKQFDTSRTGVIASAAFQQLVVAVVPGASPDHVARLLRTVDPYLTGKMTFSTCVTVLSRELAADTSTTSQKPTAGGGGNK